MKENLDLCNIACFAIAVMPSGSQRPFVFVTTVPSLCVPR